MSDKSRVRLGGFPLAATSAIAWRLQPGPRPYSTVVSVNRRQWPALKEKIGEPLDLQFRDQRGVEVVFRQVYILHVVPSAGPNLVSFVIADRRWKWSYKLVARDYNVPRKTGDRTAFGIVPIENEVIVDQYNYRRSSLNKDGRRWTAKDALRDVLTIVDGEEGENWLIESFPIADNQGEEGTLSVQNLLIRDQGDGAIGRVLSQIPGAELFVRPDGKVVVFDGADLTAAEEFRASLPPATWDGEKSEMVDRAAIRPAKVVVHYQREVEVVFDHQDDWNDTQTPPDRDTPYLENVIPTVDRETQITEYDPETNRRVTKTVPPGTWVNIKEWLYAMKLRQPSSSPFDWTFETIRATWLVGDLDGVLGSRADDEERGNVAARIQAFKQHFRQTFRINRRYMERIRDIEAIRAALLDPISGARAPAAVWGEATSIATVKGQRIIARDAIGDAASAGMYQRINSYPPAATPTIQVPPGPARVVILDHDLGIFRVEWIVSPYGTVESFIPSFLENSTGGTANVVGDLALQDDQPMGPGLVKEGGNNGIFLARTMRMKVMLTVVPAAPNNTRQFHRIEIDAGDIAEKYRTEYRIKDGKGPDLHVFVPPNEADARFGWQDDTAAAGTVSQLLGLNSEDPNEAGIDSQDLPGFVLVNGQADGNNELTAHSAAFAAEILAAYADNLQGNVATILSTNRRGDSNMALTGNMASASVVAAPYPSGKVAVVYEFPGQQRQISRMALLPASVRHLLLGIVKPGVGN